MTLKLLASFFIGLLGVISSGCGWVRGEDESQPPSAIALSPEQVRLARHLAEQDLGIDAGSTSPRERTVFVKVDLLPDSQANTGLALVMVHHYRYEGDQTVLTMVDLNTHAVLKRESATHFPTALALSEVARAEELVRADARVHSRLASGNVQLEVRPMQFGPSHPLYGHRAALVMLQDGGNYLEAPIVTVDLLAETVHVTN